MKLRISTFLFALAVAAPCIQPFGNVKLTSPTDGFTVTAVSALFPFTVFELFPSLTFSAGCTHAQSAITLIGISSLTIVDGKIMATPQIELKNSHGRNHDNEVM